MAFVKFHAKAGVVKNLLWRDDESDARYGAYVNGLSTCLGHADRWSRSGPIARAFCCRGKAFRWSRWRRVGVSTGKSAESGPINLFVAQQD